MCIIEYGLCWCTLVTTWSPRPISKTSQYQHVHKPCTDMWRTICVPSSRNIDSSIPYEGPCGVSAVGRSSARRRSCKRLAFKAIAPAQISSTVSACPAKKACKKGVRPVSGVEKKAATTFFSHLFLATALSGDGGSCSVPAVVRAIGLGLCLGFPTSLPLSS